MGRRPLPFPPCLKLRSYTYDRSGYGSCQLSPLPPSAENIAVELSLLIEKAGITNPIILVGHSWAGVIVMELSGLMEKLRSEGKSSGVDIDIAGLVLVDANHETALQVLDPNDENLAAMSKGLDAYSAMGIEAEHKLTPSEWEAFLADKASQKFKLQEAKEGEQYVPSFPTLLKKELWKRQPMMGDKPVFVIGGMRSRDWGGLYKAGAEKGNGTEEERINVKKLIGIADEKNAGLMKEWLKLSTRGKLVFARESGHFVQLTQPDVVVEGVKSVLDEIQTSEIGR